MQIAAGDNSWISESQLLQKLRLGESWFKDGPGKKSSQDPVSIKTKLGMAWT
jgi:hypothetical protein